MNIWCTEKGEPEEHDEILREKHIQRALLEVTSTRFHHERRTRCQRSYHVCKGGWYERVRYIATAQPNFVLFSKKSKKFQHHIALLQHWIKSYGITLLLQHYFVGLMIVQLFSVSFCAKIQHIPRFRSDSILKFLRFRNRSSCKPSLPQVWCLFAACLGLDIW